MIRYEYKVRPAPTKGLKAKGLKTPEARFAHTIEDAINAQAAKGWEYQRTDILPSDERQGLTSSHTVYRTVMVFRRAVENDTLENTDSTAEPDAAEDSHGDEDLSETSEDDQDDQGQALHADVQDMADEEDHSDPSNEDETPKPA